MTTALIIVVASLVTALVMSDLHLMSLDVAARDRTAAIRLLTAALSRSGVGALWGSLFGILLAAQVPQARVLSTVSDIATVGVFLGLATCVLGAERLTLISAKGLINGRRARYIVGAVVVLVMVFDLLYALIPVVWD